MCYFPHHQTCNGMHFASTCILQYLSLEMAPFVITINVWFKLNWISNHCSYFIYSSSLSSRLFVFRCVLALDEVGDPQNLGALIRTAHFLGCYKIVVCAKNSAPLSAAVSKASAGALEVSPISVTHDMVKFLEGSAANGWQVLYYFMFV